MILCAQGKLRGRPPSRRKKVAWRLEKAERIGLYGVQKSQAVKLCVSLHSLSALGRNVDAGGLDSTMSQCFAEQNRPRSCRHPALLRPHRTCQTAAGCPADQETPQFFGHRASRRAAECRFFTASCRPAEAFVRTPPAAAMKSLRFCKTSAAASTITAGGFGKLRSAANTASSHSFILSAENCTAATSPKMSTISPGRPSPSLFTSRYAVVSERGQPNRTAQQARFVNPPRNQRCHMSRRRQRVIGDSRKRPRV